MKECKYCGTEYADGLNECPNCGSTVVVSAEEKKAEREREKEEKAIRLAEKRKLDPRKKVLLGLIIGIMAIIAIIVISVSATKARNSQVVTDDGKTNQDLKQVYNEASALIDSGDYEKGLQKLDSIPDTYTDYRKVEQKKEEAITKYVDGIIANVDTYVEKERYTDALALISHALDIVGKNEILTEKQKSVLAGCKEKYLADAEEMAKSKNYDEAISTLAALSDQVGQDADIDAKVLEYRKLRADVKLAKFDESDDLEGAIKYLQEEVKNSGNNVDLNAKLNTYISKYKTSLFATAETTYKDEGYASVKVLLQEGLKLIGTDEEVSNKLETYTKQYKEKLTADAETKYKEEGYEAAVQLLENGDDEIGGDQDIKGLIEQYKNKAPVKITSLTPVNSDAYVYTFDRSLQDYDGKAYDDGIYKMKASYLLNGEYKSLTAEMFGLLEYRDSMWGAIEIYADDKLVYEKTVEYYSYRPGDRGAHIEVDLTGVNVLKIIKSGDTTCLSEATLYK